MTQSSSHRPFRFGVLAEHSVIPRSLLETARRAEAAGFATLLLRDHFIQEPFGHQLGPITALASVAAATTTLRIGTLVVANDYRHPVVVAKEFATLDQFSDGRVELGLGAGFSVPEYARAGIPLDSARTRIDRLEESLRVIKGLWADGPCTFRGQHYTVDGLEAYPRPLQQPRPPLLVAGGGRRILSMGAREADSISLLSAPIVNGRIRDDAASRLPESLEERLGWIRAAAEQRLPQLELSLVGSIRVTQHPLQAAEDVGRAHRWHATSAEQILSMPSQLIGCPAAIVEALHERRERYGITYVILSDADLDSAAPIVAQLAGR